jgi:putative toxin-antitoxin system antitoxin component (TIGR02293 family)
VADSSRGPGKEPLVHEILGTPAPAGPTLRAAPEALRSLAAGGYSEAEIFELVVPKRTLARRQAMKQPLTIEETDKALRLARIADLARRVFGDGEKAHRWLRKPKRELSGRTPLAYLASENGARTVEQMLQRIDHGMFT